ncbi:uncharacterized protein PAC_09420 [Phialocephala subalpina]|uniref:Uncharacterized protein n=1 Tax=Phialocephala subalpina TaxID=576137 RepID=A0A1L7X3F2_9HELO|nr:uncharacterized protein PAC_09420 [Phialocephala subalpina]
MPLWNERYFDDSFFDPQTRDWNDCCWLYHNGLTAFYNLTDPNQVDCSCVAPFEGDPDIAGPGVMYAFIVTGWITCMVVAVATYCALSKLVYTSLPPRNNDHWQTEFKALVDKYTFSELPPRFVREHGFLAWAAKWITRCQRAIVFITLLLLSKKFSKAEEFSKKALDVLCDIQLVTGIGIIIAALAQGNTMKFYHQQFVITYWLLCVNSFWAARSGEMSQSDDHDDWHFWTRTVAILISAVLSAYCQIVTIPRKWGPKGEWDPLTSGYCYLSHDKSTYGLNFLWIAGLICYAAYLMFVLAREATRSIITLLKLEEQRDHWKSSLKTPWTSCTALIPPWLKSNGAPADSPATNIGNLNDAELFRWFAKQVQNRAWRLIWSLFRQFIALWAWGDVHSPLIVAAYFGFTAWNTYGLIDMKHSNAGLVADETTWGFGQVLPVVLLGLIILNLMDALQDARKDKSIEDKQTSPSEDSVSESHELQRTTSVHISRTTSQQNTSHGNSTASQENASSQKMVYR